MSLGASYYPGENRQKVFGADMLPAVILSLAYDVCPVDYCMYLLEDTDEYYVIDWDGLSLLVDELARALNKEIRPLTVGSTKQYLHALRKGRRANRNGTLPPVNVKFNEDRLELRIPRMSKDDNAIRQIPSWIFPRVVL